MNYDEIGAAVGASIASAVAIAFGVRKALRDWVSDNNAMAKDNAELGMIQLLREESERLSGQNAKLMAQINALQLEVGVMHSNIIQLRTENESLKIEVSRLSGELGAIKNQHDRIEKEFRESDFMSVPPGHKK